MPLPTGYPAEDASFDGIDFWELSPEGRYASVAPDTERVIVGQTVIGRYVKPVDVAIQGLCGLDEADDFEAATNSTGTLNWHKGSDTARLVRPEIKRIPDLGVAEITLNVII